MSMSFKKRTQARKTYRGNSVQTKAVAAAATKATGLTGLPKTVYSAPKYVDPVPQVMTNYGAKSYRTASSAKQYTGLTGSPQKAVILDIDGTLSGHGMGLDDQVTDFLKKHYKAGHLFVVVTARDDYMYETSFNWLMRHLPYPFIGPFNRNGDDRRYASEFKRQLAQGWEDMGLWQIVGAADDNAEVIAMWKQWAKEHFDKPEDFDLLEASYGAYADWRKNLPSKGDYQSYSGTGYGYYSDIHKDEVWIRSVQGADGKWSQSHWAKKGSAEDLAQKARDVSKYSGSKSGNVWSKDPTDGVMKAEKNHGTQPKPGDDITQDNAWNTYLAVRQGKGAYDDEDLYTYTVERAPFVPDDEGVGSEYRLDRKDIELWVAHDYPTMTPDDIKSMSDKELWEAVDLDFEQELYDAIADKFSGVFATDDLKLLESSELEELLTFNDVDQAEDYVDGLVKYITRSQGENQDLDIDPDDNPLAGLGPKDERQELENEVYANSDLAINDIVNMDTEVLRQIIAHNNMLNDLDEDGINMPPTEELNVAEILAEMGEKPHQGDDVVDEVEKLTLPDPNQLGFDYTQNDEAQQGVA